LIETILWQLKPFRQNLMFFLLSLPGPGSEKEAAATGADL
jgi:hypothetical protein